MRKPTFQRQLLPLSIAAALAAPMAAQAQEDLGFALEEVVVTAQKREESLQDTPIAVSAFSGAGLQELSVSGLKDIGQFTPNMAITSGPTGGNDGFYYIRGVGQGDVNAATDPGVGTYLDGVYLGRTGGSSLDMLDIQRIEVLRGPQGTLFGRNTIGGAVNVVTANPSFDGVYGTARVTAGERNRLDAGVSVNAPLSDTVAARISLLSKQQDGWGERVYDDQTLGDVDTQAGRVKLLWDVTPDFSALFSADMTRSRGTSNHQVLTGFDPSVGTTPLAVPFPSNLTDDTSADRYDSFVSIDPRHESDIAGTSLTLDWDVHAFTIKSITAYRTLEQDITNDYDGTRWTLYDNRMVTDQSQFSQEFQFSGLALNDRLNWLVGVYYYEEDIDYLNKITMGTNDGTPPGAVTPRFGQAISNNQAFTLDITSQALFGQATYDLTDRMSLTLGLRYNEEEKEQAFDFFIDNTAGVFNFAGFPPMVIPTLSPDNPMLTVPTTYSESWESLTPKVSLEYQLTDQSLAYLSYTEGFRSGGFNGRPTPDGSGQFGPVNGYDPEKVASWEAGLKSEFWENRLRLNAAAFYSDYTDMQQLVLNSSGFFDYANAAQAELKGLELELTALVTQNFELRAGLGYTDAEYTEVDQAAIASGITLDTELPVTPELTYNLGGTYSWYLDNLGSLQARVDHAFQSEVWYGATNQPLEFQDDVALTNVRLTWRNAAENLAVALYGTNVFEEEYYTNAQDVRQSLGVAFAGVSEPSEWGLELNYDF